jgi:hypothetical protein
MLQQVFEVKRMLTRRHMSHSEEVDIIRQIVFPKLLAVSSKYVDV